MERHEFFLQNICEVLDRLHAAGFESVCVAAVCFADAHPAARDGENSAVARRHRRGFAAALFFDGRDATIASVYGEIPSSLPALAMPDLSRGTVAAMLPSVMLIAALGGVESLLSAVVADGMSGTRQQQPRADRQGVANNVAPLFGGIPETGAIARTAANIRAGAASRLSGVIHGVVVLLVLVLLAPQASRIPLAAMTPV